MQVGIGYSEAPDSAAAGRQAVEEALSKVDRTEPCNIVLLFCTARHNQVVLRDAVSKATKNKDHIYGGGAVGVITNKTFGYAGDQVGVACIWLDEVECNVLTEGKLFEGELETGIRLGKKLAAIGTKPNSSVMLFYDAIDVSTGDIRLMMATWLLEGLEKGLGFLPDAMTGAGMQGDHICSPTSQFIGSSIGRHQTMALAFSDNIRIDSSIMHGCRPASGYYTVTKAEGPIILEINNKPALEFMDEMLSSAITPEDYPFFLLFGLNQGERWGEYNESNYASRLCLGIDKERGGIVMFEPDMVAGTEFQLMYRSFNLEYMRPKIETLFDQLGDREPLFAMYIDCAGRCAGYGGIDMEDAVVLQEIVGDRVPLLGLYTGVEIAPMGGRPRGLDWTGVFCLFSKGSTDESVCLDKPSVWGMTDKEEGMREAPLEAMQKLLEQNAAKILELDTQSIAIRHELEQKRRGFKLLAELSVSLRQSNDYFCTLRSVTQRINAALNMQKTVVLRNEDNGVFVPIVLQGFSVEESDKLEKQQFAVDEAMIELDKPIIVTGADNQERFGALRKMLNLPYFISVPIVVRNEVVALLITGRMIEAPPFFSRLGSSGAETIQAVCAVLSSVLVHQRLDIASKEAQSDSLTGLYNRRALELQVEALLNSDRAEDQVFAFLMIDFDHFKKVNDTYGHVFGDEALKILAKTLQKNFRSTDIVARLGGDEFVVVCPTSKDIVQITRKIEDLIEKWHKTPISIQEEPKLYATLSIGVALAPRDGTSYNELFHRADLALYKSKELGRDRFTIYDGSSMGTMRSYEAK